MVWHIINAEQISPKGLKTFQERVEADNNWFADVIKQALNQGYDNAIEMYGAFKQAEPKTEINLDFDETELDVFMLIYQTFAAIPRR